MAANLSFAAVAISLTHTVKTLEPAFNVVLSQVGSVDLWKQTALPWSVSCQLAFNVVLSQVGGTAHCSMRLSLDHAPLAMPLQHTHCLGE